MINYYKKKFNVEEKSYISKVYNSNNEILI